MNNEELSQAQTEKKEPRSIIRIVHNRENPYVRLNKKALWDKRLSLRAVGLWARCLSKPDDWKFCMKNLVSEFKEGKKVVYATIKELMEFGYCIRLEHNEKSKNGRFGTNVIEYVFFEFEATQEEKNEQLEKFKKSFRNPTLGNPRLGNPPKEPLLSIYSTKEGKLLKKEGGEKPPKQKDPPPPIFNSVPEKEAVEKFGDYVRLTQKEYDSLCAEIGKPSVDAYIEKMNFKKFEYHNYHDKIRSWYIDDKMKGISPFKAAFKSKAEVPEPTAPKSDVERNMQYAKDKLLEASANLSDDVRYQVFPKYVLLDKPSRSIQAQISYTDNGFQQQLHNMLVKIGAI